MNEPTVRTRRAGDVLIAYVDGYLNSLLGEAVERLVQEYLDAGGRHVIVSFEGTKLINSIGISIIIGVVEKIMEHSGALSFCSLTRVNRELFEMTGVARHVRIYATEDDALAHVR